MIFEGWWPRLKGTIQGLLPSSSPPVARGFYTYPIELDGGKRRIHLRVAAEGHGILFIDVTDAIHLNPTAVHMVKLALDGVERDCAQQQLLHWYRGVEPSELTQGLTEMYELVAQLKATGDGCPICQITSRVGFQPIFSMPVTAPYKVDVALTYSCNNACPHCYNEPERFTMPSLSTDEWFRVFDRLADIGVPHVILTGGEPTLRSDLVDLIRYADGLGLVVGMNTNGRRLARPGMAESLVDAGLNHVQVTLESCNAAVHNAMVGVPHGRAFDETVAGIQNAIASGLHTITNTTLTQQNQDHALDIVHFVHDLGLRTFAMNGMIYAGGGTRTPDAIPAEAMAALLAAVRDEAAVLDLRFLWYTVTDYCRLSPVALGLDPKRCNAGEYSMCIEPNGDVLPCQSYYVAAGNILTDDWDAIWNSELFRSFRDREEDPAAAGLPQACWDCPDLDMCGGGCRLEREAAVDLRAAEHGCSRARSHIGEMTSARASGSQPVSS